MFMYPSKHAKIPVVVKEKKRGGVSVHARETRENARVRHTRTHTNERSFYVRRRELIFLARWVKSLLFAKRFVPR